MGCTFCATGTMGIKGDLTAGEIIEQLVHARAVSPIRNIGELSPQHLAEPDSQPGMCAAVGDARLRRVPHCNISEAVGCPVLLLSCWSKSCPLDIRTTCRGPALPAQPSEAVSQEPLG